LSLFTSFEFLSFLFFLFFPFLLFRFSSLNLLFFHCSCCSPFSSRPHFSKDTLQQVWSSVTCQSNPELRNSLKGKLMKLSKLSKLNLFSSVLRGVSVNFSQLVRWPTNSIYYIFKWVTAPVSIHQASRLTFDCHSWCMIVTSCNRLRANLISARTRTGWILKTWSCQGQNEMMKCWNVEMLKWRRDEMMIASNSFGLHMIEMFSQNMPFQDEHKIMSANTLKMLEVNEKIWYLCKFWQYFNELILEYHGNVTMWPCDHVTICLCAYVTMRLSVLWLFLLRKSTELR
jgi:hypothetical protein